MTQQLELFERIETHMSAEWPQYVLDYEADLPALRELVGSGHNAFLQDKSYTEAVFLWKQIEPEKIVYFQRGSAEISVSLLELPEGVWAWGYWALNHRACGRCSPANMGAGRVHLALSREEAIQKALHECADVFGVSDIEEVIRGLKKAPKPRWREEDE